MWPLKLLIVNTSAEIDAETEAAINKLIEASTESKVINTRELNISYCVGCCNCMLKTPGICCLKDDYEPIIKDVLCYEHIVFIVDTVLNFVTADGLNVMQRLFPFMTVLAEYKNGRILHTSRYKKEFSIELIYKGDIEKSLINQWFEQYADHFNCTSVGTYNITNIEEACKCIS